MAETMNYGWLQDYQGVKFAPKTLLPYIFNIDGIPIEQNLELQNLKVINQITGTADNSINASKLSNIEIKEGTRVWTPMSEGSNSKPIYFEKGVPKEIGYTIEKSVPSDAVFTDTTYSTATQQKEGLMSAEDKIKLDGLSIPEIPDQIKYKAGNGLSLDAAGTTFSHADTSNAQTFTSNNRTYVTGLTFDNYGHVTGYTTGTENVQNFTLSPATESKIGGVKPGTGLEVKDDGTLNVTISAGTNFELKPATSTSLGGVLADPNGAINVDTKGIVTLKNNYAGSVSDGGSATSAEKLTSGTIGSETQPVYFSNGVPVALNNTIETGTWTPRLNYTDPTFQVNSATYIKIGDLVVINFIINSGVTMDITLPENEQYFTILTSSLPYAPDFSTGTDLWYAGGGHLQYAKSAAQNCYFTGWAITENHIYARGASIRENNIMDPTYMYWPSKEDLEGSLKENVVHAGGTIMYKTTGVKN